MEETEKTLDGVLDEVIGGNQQDPGTKDPEVEEQPPGSEETPPNEDGADPSEKEGEKTPPADPPKKEESSVIRELRSQQREAKAREKEYEATIERIAKQQGISKDELLANLQDQADKKQAEELKISPEIQKKLREQEEMLEKLQVESQRRAFNSRYDDLVKEYPMDTEQGKAFVQTAMDHGFDLMNPSLDFKTVYRALNYDTLVSDVRKQVEQEVLARIEKQQNKSPGISQKRGQSDGAKTGDIDAALSEIIGT